MSRRPQGDGYSFATGGTGGGFGGNGSGGGTGDGGVGLGSGFSGMGSHYTIAAIAVVCRKLDTHERSHR